MTNAYSLSIRLAPACQKLLGIDDLAHKIEELPRESKEILSRSFGPSELIGLAGVFVSIVSLALQMRSDFTKQTLPDEQLIERIMAKIENQSSLNEETTTKLVRKVVIMIEEEL